MEKDNKTFLEMMGGNPTFENVEILRKDLFNFDYGFYSTVFKPRIERKFIRHYLEYKPAFDTYSLFKFYLESWMNEYLDYYNSLYYANQTLTAYSNADYTRSVISESNTNSVGTNDNVRVSNVNSQNNHDNESKTTDTIRGINDSTTDGKSSASNLSTTKTNTNGSNDTTTTDEGKTDQSVKSDGIDINTSTNVKLSDSENNTSNHVSGSEITTNKNDGGLVTTSSTPTGIKKTTTGHYDMPITLKLSNDNATSADVTMDEFDNYKENNVVENLSGATTTKEFSPDNENLTISKTETKDNDTSDSQLKKSDKVDTISNNENKNIATSKTSSDDSTATNNESNDLNNVKTLNKNNEDNLHVNNGTSVDVGRTISNDNTTNKDESNTSSKNSDVETIRGLNISKSQAYMEYQTALRNLDLEFIGTAWDLFMTVWE